MSKERKVRNMMQDIEVGKVFATKDYEKFENMLYNRTLDETNLKGLISSMSENYYPSPILVTPDFKVIDGQHRLEAIKRLSKKLYYTVINIKEEESVEAIKDLNRVSKTWTLKDYIKYYADRGNQNYINLIKLMQKFPKIKNTLIYIYIGQDGFKRDKKRSPYNAGGHIRKGEFKFVDWEQSVRTCEDLYDYQHLKKIFKTELFKNCMIRLFKLKSYNHTQMINALTKHQDALMSVNKVDDMINQITKIYNIGKKNRVFFYTEYQEWLKVENEKRLENLKKRSKKC